MANVNSLKVKAGKGKSTRDLSFDHVSTIDFNVVKPMGVFELVPGDQLHVRPEIWMRTQALNCPTFGKMDVISRAFFVPMRLCWSNFNDFYRKAPLKTSTGLQYFQHTPRYGMRELSRAFLNRFVEGDLSTQRVPIDVISGVASRMTFGIYSQDSSPASAYMDFSVRSAANCISYRFNPLGKRVYDLFISLGYRFQFFSDFQGSTNSGTQDNVYSPSLMPLLAWLRMFQDWYCPSEFKYLFKPDPLADVVNVTSVHIAEILDELTWACYLFFNDDMFSMCENAPYRKGNNTVDPGGNTLSQQMGMPNSIIPSDAHDSSFSNVQTDGYLGGMLKNFGSSQSAGNLDYTDLQGKQWLGRNRNDIDTYSTVFSRADPNYAGGALNQQVSNWTIKAVMSMATWLQRNNLLSSRVTEYLKAKFGVTPSSARMQVTEYIGSKLSPVKIGDIPCTESQDLAVLGAKGTSYNIDDLRYTAEEFGYVLFTVELRPRVGYGQGVDPLVLRTRLDEFYNEEFDALGFEPVPTHTLVSGPINYNTGVQSETANLGATDNRIFGYLPRLWSYKCKHDNLSGDFGVPKYLTSGIQAFHLMRNVDGEDLEGFIHNSLSFRYAGLTYYDNKYARIFNNNELAIGIEDHFSLICSFDAEVNGLPLALNESWQVNQDHNEREGHMTNIQASL